MKRSFFSFLPAAFALSLLLAVGCQKQVDNNTDQVDDDAVVLAAEDDAEADITYGEVGDLVLGVNGELGLGTGLLFDPITTGNPNPDVETMDPVTPPCVTITITPKDPGVFPKKVVMDFGTGCKGRDGRMRKGKIITMYSKPMVVPGAEAVTEFDGYFINEVKVEGRHVVRNKSTSDVRIFTRLVQNGKLTRPNGNYVKWNAEHTEKQVAGLGTPGFPRDDEWTITGGAKGETSRNGVVSTWTRLIIEPLHKAFTCRWFDSGKVRITRNDKVAVLNYGNGTCDDKATITINGDTKEITLK